MCPNCHRGLVYPNKEVCEMCGGTGFYNPASLPANEVPMDEQNTEETVVTPEAEAVVETTEVSGEDVAAAE